MLDFILDVIYMIIMCYWNGFLIKWSIEAFNSKEYVSFGAYCTLVFYNFVILVRHLSLPVG